MRTELCCLKPVSSLACSCPELGRLWPCVGACMWTAAKTSHHVSGQPGGLVQDRWWVIGCWNKSLPLGLQYSYSASTSSSCEKIHFALLSGFRWVTINATFSDLNCLSLVCLASLAKDRTGCSWSPLWTLNILEPVEFECWLPLWCGLGCCSLTDVVFKAMANRSV